jgi:tRNA(Ile)-lysidine synthase
VIPIETKSKFGRRFEQRLQERIKAEDLLRRGERVLVALSGGPDSMTLLASLFHLREHLKIEVAVAHFNHRLRSESGDDAAFCRAVAEGLRLAFRLGDGDVRVEAEAEGRSIEDAARSARYAFLAEAAAGEGCAVVATGHNADDQAETVLMRLLRGSGGSGLRAMVGRGRFPAKTVLPLELARPLLETKREEILRYCVEEQLQFVDDPSNQSLEYTRNRIRHEVLPSLRIVNPAVDEALRRAARALSRDEDHLESQAEEALVAAVTESGLDRAALLRTHSAIAIRTLRLWGRRKGVQLQADESEKLLELVRAGRGGLDVSREWRVVVSEEGVAWEER